MYVNEFHDAIKNSKILFKKTIQFKHKNTQYNDVKNLEKMSKEISQYLSHLNYEQLVSNCGPFHNFIKPKIEEIYQCKAYLTIGYVTTNNSEYHSISLSDVKQSIKKRILPSSHHAWLTLDNYEVLDMTFLTSLGIIQNNPDALGGVIQQNSDSLKDDMRYHPILVGEDFFYKCNFDLEQISNLMYADL